MRIGKVLSNDAAVALRPNSARISGRTGPTEVVKGRSVIPTKNSGMALRINFCWDLTDESDTKTPLADDASLAGAIIGIDFGI
jgi:hypothetical protein